MKINKMKENVIQTKSFEFAIRIINIVKYLQNDKREFILSKQIMRSSTSVGTNIEEAIEEDSLPKILLLNYLYHIKKQGKRYIS